MGHTDFRVGGKIFATLGSPDEESGMVSLLPDQQELAIEAEPAAFRPAAGAWGRGGFLPEDDIGRILIAAVGGPCDASFGLGQGLDPILVPVD